MESRQMTTFAAELQRLERYASERLDSRRFDFVDLVAVVITIRDSLRGLAAAAEGISEDLKAEDPS